MALQPNSGPGLLLWGFITITFLWGLMLVQRPTPNLEDQVSVFMTPGDRVAQLYPQALGTRFSRLLPHAWVTVGLFFNPGHHTRDLKERRKKTDASTKDMLCLWNISSK
jgi:hypothetical protein